MSIGFSGRANKGSGAAPPPTPARSRPSRPVAGRGGADEALLVKDSQRAVGTTAHRVLERALPSLGHSSVSAACALPPSAGGAANGSTAYDHARARADVLT